MSVACRGPSGVAVDVETLSAAIAGAIGTHYDLIPLKVKCTYPVFRGEAFNALPVFVKVGLRGEWQRTMRVLREVGASGLFAEFLTTEAIAYQDKAVFVMTWRETKVVRPEDMSEAQVDAFVSECVRLSDVLQRVPDVPSADDLPDAPERLYDIVRGYASRCPWVSRMLAGLLAIPFAERTFDTRPRAVVHGDFHSKNFGFMADGRMSVCDFDKMRLGLACGDLANALLERFSCLGLSRAARRRLLAVTVQAVRRSPWPREDFVRICQVTRLAFAARRIRKHPNATWVAFDILRRDCKIREFLDCLEKVR